MRGRFLQHPGVLASDLFAHPIGSFLDLALLDIACWRSGACPGAPLVAARDASLS